MKPRHIILTFLVLAVIAQSIYYYPKLPDQIACHFNSAGQADNWMLKVIVFAINIGIVVFITILFLAIPLSFRYIPDSLINLPKKDYWLAPERRDETINFINRQSSWFGISTILFLLAVFELGLRANLREPVQMSNAYVLIFLGIYLAFTLIWLVRFIVRFYRIT